MKPSPRRIQPFNPLDKRNLADSIAAKLFQQPCESLPPEAFWGAGVYALYYCGDFPLYTPIRNSPQSCASPIYVGKAVPKGARKGGIGLGEAPSSALFDRLADHASSLVAAGNLHIEDFRCRFLVVDDIWIPLAEAILIETFHPLWNSVVDGFGNHDPGAGRYAQKRSPWDVLHPGRVWANRLAPCAKTHEELLTAVRTALM